MRSDAAKQPRKGAKESETSPRTEEELAETCGRDDVAATMAAVVEVFEVVGFAEVVEVEEVVESEEVVEFEEVEVVEEVD